jgi:hypothetical protein
VDNNAYTNVMTVWVLLRAWDALSLLPNWRRADLIEMLGLRPEELQRWTDISQRMYVPMRGEGIPRVWTTAPGEATSRRILGEGNLQPPGNPPDAQPLQDRTAGKDLAMKAKVGDRLVEEGKHVGDHQRVGVVTALRHADGTPPYTVRWLDSGHEALVYPGSDARIEPAHSAEPSG